MPHLRFRSLESKNIAALSASLPSQLAAIMQTSEDNFTFEAVATQYFNQGQPTESYPFVEVLWFARSQQIQDESARIITDAIKILIVATDVVVVFQVLNPTAYYENGEHF
jgi:hypothetical protein